MKKALLLITYLICLQNNGSAQNKIIDSLQSAISSPGIADSTKVNMLASLSRQYENIAEFAKGLEAAKKGLALAQEINYKPGEALCCLNIGNIYSDQSDFPNALDYYFKNMKINEESGNKLGKATIYNNIGNIYLTQSDNAKALSYYLKSLDINKIIDYKHGMTNNYANIGLVYMYQYDFPKAMEYYLKNLAINEGTGDKKGIGNIYSYIGDLYINVFKNDSTGAGLLTKNGHVSHAALLDSAYALQKKSLAVNRELGDKYADISRLWSIGNVYYYKQKYTEAISYFQQSYTLAGSLGAINDKKEAAKSISDCYRKLDDCQKAFSWYEKYIQGKDSVFNEAKNKEITSKELYFYFEKKEVADSLKAQEVKEVNEIKLQRQKVYTYGGFAALSIVILLLFFVYRNYNKQRIANMELYKAQQKLIKSEKMAAFGLLTSRVAHEIRNPLNFVNNFSELSEEIVKEIISSDNEEDKKAAALLLVENLKKIQHHGKRVEDIINKLQEHLRAGTAHEFFEKE